MKLIKIFLTCSLVAALLVSGLTVSAADYTIIIKESKVTTSYDVIFSATGIGTGDVITHDINVSNQADYAHAIRLVKVEAVEDSGLLDKLIFSFGETGGKEFSFTGEDFDSIDLHELYVAAKKSDGSFKTTVKVGILTNEYQNTSTTIRYHFEATQLYGDREPGESPKTGDDSNMTLWLALMAGSLLTLIFSFVWKRRKKEENKEAQAV